MASLPERFRPWEASDPIPGFPQLLMPETFGTGLPSLRDAMSRAGYQRHEIAYIQDYTRVAGVSEQEAVLHLGIGGHDRIAAATALWKGLPWLPLHAAKNLRVQPLRPYAIPPQFGESTPRAVPIHQSAKGLLYATHMEEDLTRQSCHSFLLSASRKNNAWIRALEKLNIADLSPGEILERIQAIHPDDLQLAIDESRRGKPVRPLEELLIDRGLVTGRLLYHVLTKRGKPDTSRLREAFEQDAFLLSRSEEVPPVFFAVTSSGSVDGIYQRGILDTEKNLELACRMESADRYGEILHRLLVHCAYQGYSDIHFTPLQKAGIIERRLDGIKGLLRTFTRQEYERLVGVIINRMGNVDVRLQAEGRLPPEQMPAELRGRFEFRIEYMNVVQGDGVTGSLTLRVMNLMNETADMDTLGFTPDDLSYLRKVLHTGKGLVICTGPTGSGKTTTLYAMMRSLDAIQHSIQSVENPVEIRVGLWRQHQLLRERPEHEEWADWNKGLLRNDPDIVLQGEVRNADLFLQVADMANTGHFVMTTFHATSAALAIGRIRQMRTSNGDALDIDMISSLIHCILAQGLARKLCPHCAVPDDREETRAFLASLPESLHQPHTPRMARDGGCPHCRETGYQGRFLVYEILRFDRSLRERVAGGISIADIEKHQDPDTTMIGQLRKFVASGRTSLDEAYRLSGEILA